MTEKQVNFSAQSLRFEMSPVLMVTKFEEEVISLQAVI